MNRKLIFVTSLTALPVACAAPPATPAVSSEILHCKSGPAADVCPPGLANRNKVTVHVTPNNLTVVPPVVCAEHGTDIAVTITKANSVASPLIIVTVPKDAENGWIVNSNGAGDSTMTITVPAATDVGPKYGYFVVANNGQCLDPKIHVDK
jgi:hypothetical protein